jgi:Uma2 family endonuclease
MNNPRIRVSTFDRFATARYDSSVGKAPLMFRRWKRAEYERLVDLGLFQGDPVELIGGKLVVAEPQGSYHAAALGAADDALRAVLPPGWIVRDQMPVALDDESAPEPDLVLVPGTRADYCDGHPSRPALVLEIADSSLDFDRQHKGSLYARAGVEDYWIVNLIDRVLEVYRDPGADPSAPYGWRYRSVRTLVPPAAVAPLALPSTHIAVAELLP